MAYETIDLQTDDRGVARLTLARPDMHNAMNGTMYDEARAALALLDRDPAVRVVVLSGQGPSFCSGGDFRYQQQQRGRPRPEKVAEARKLALWLQELDVLTKPVIGRINGPAYGGGLGLICACDIAIGVDTARFALTEARIGMLAGMISPYVVKRIGEPNARRLMLHSRPFGAAEAVSFGMLARSVPEGALDQAVEEEIGYVLACAPAAVSAAKALIRYVASHGPADNLQFTVDRVADMWDWPEAEEGMRSFFEKRKPSWHVQPRPASEPPQDSEI